jgi:acyl-CoA hydrolase
MSDDTTSSEATGGGHLLRWLVLIALAIGAIVAGRRFAISSSDRKFEERLREVDARRE